MKVSTEEGSCQESPHTLVSNYQFPEVDLLTLDGL